MKQDALAPWAEPVLGAPFPATGGYLLTVDDDGWAYEIVEGRLVRMPGSRFGDSVTGLLLGAALAEYASTHGLGRVTGADGIYNLTPPGASLETLLSPDLAFVSSGRYPPEDSPEYNTILRLAPDLVAEVVSPNQFRPEMEEKVRRYLDAGVRLAWLVWSKYRQVDVWRPGSDTPLHTLGAGGQLDGLDVLPGFTYPIARLFPGA